MRKNIVIAIAILLAILLTVYFFKSGVRETRAYRLQSGAGQGK